MREVVRLCEDVVIDTASQQTLAITIVSILVGGLLVLLLTSAFYYSRTGPFRGGRQ
jgi:hypothetical protein